MAYHDAHRKPPLSMMPMFKRGFTNCPYVRLSTESRCVTFVLL
jgi:hypothetical protein